MVEQKPPTVGSVMESDDISAATNSFQNTAESYAGLFNGKSTTAGVGLGFSGAFGNVAGVSSLSRAQSGTTIFGTPLDDEDEEGFGKINLATLTALASSDQTSFLGSFVEFMAAFIGIKESKAQTALEQKVEERAALVSKIQDVVQKTAASTSNPAVAEQYLDHCRTEIRFTEQIRQHPSFLRLSDMRQAAVFDYTAPAAADETSENLSPRENLALGARAIEEMGIMTTEINGFDHVVYQDETGAQFAMIGNERVEDFGDTRGDAPVIIPAHFTDIQGMIRLSAASAYEVSLQHGIANGDIKNPEDIAIAIEELELKELVAQRHGITRQRQELKTIIGSEITPEQRETLEDLWMLEIEMDRYIEQKQIELSIAQTVSGIMDQDSFQNKMETHLRSTPEGQFYIRHDTVERIIQECIDQQDVTPAVRAGVTDTIISQLEENGVRIDAAPEQQQALTTDAAREPQSDLQVAFTEPNATPDTPAQEDTTAPAKTPREALGDNFENEQDNANSVPDTPGEGADATLENDGHR